MLELFVWHVQKPDKLNSMTVLFSSELFQRILALKTLEALKVGHKWTTLLSYFGTLKGVKFGPITTIALP